MVASSSILPASAVFLMRRFRSPSEGGQLAVGGWRTMKDQREGMAERDTAHVPAGMYLCTAVSAHTDPQSGT